MKYNIFEQFINYIHGRGKQPDLSLPNSTDKSEGEENSEAELLENIEMAKKLGAGSIVPDPTFAKKLLNEMKLELREQTIRRVKLPVWKINFKFNWLMATPVVVIVLVFLVWGFKQTDAPVVEFDQNPLLGLQANKVTDKNAATEPIMRQEKSLATSGGRVNEAREDFAAAPPAAAELLSKPRAPVTQGVTKETQANDESFDSELDDDLNNFDNLFSELENFGSELDGLDNNLNNF